MKKESKRNWDIVIGLEIHAQLLTESKIYSSDANQYGCPPNTNISSITLAHPGSMPKLNKKVVEFAIKMGLALECDITRENIFDRKNYFYPDLPKGFQLTQDKTPICIGGFIPIKTKNGDLKRIKLTKIHMEEDAGKSIHIEGKDESQIDLNRAGVPLIEIVTEPDIYSSDDAVSALQEVRKIVRYLEICDGNMEEGSFRCDANVSVKPGGSNTLGKKVEVKNMNSFRSVQRAIDYEYNRQVKLLENNEEVVSETRLYDAANGTTVGMRTKEELNDYRYFPEPDLSPLYVSEELLNEIKAQMPLLPAQLYQKLIVDYGLPAYDAEVLTEEKAMANYFEEVCVNNKNYKAVSNWLMGPLKSMLNELNQPIDRFPLKPRKIADLIKLIDDGKVSFSSASQNLFPEFVNNPDESPEKLAEKLNLLQESDDKAILGMIDEVLRAMPDKVKAYKNGKKGLIGLFMGQLMQKSQGKADPKLANQLLKDALENI